MKIIICMLLGFGVQAQVRRLKGRLQMTFTTPLCHASNLPFLPPGKVFWAFPNTHETYESHFSPWRHCRKCGCCAHSLWNYRTLLPWFWPKHMATWSVMVTFRIGFPELSSKIAQGLSEVCTHSLQNKYYQAWTATPVTRDSRATGVSRRTQLRLQHRWLFSSPTPSKWRKKPS